MAEWVTSLAFSCIFLSSVVGVSNPADYSMWDSPMICPIMIKTLNKESEIPTMTLFTCIISNFLLINCSTNTTILHDFLPCLEALQHRAYQLYS